MGLRRTNLTVILLLLVTGSCFVSRTGELYRNRDYSPADLGFYQLETPRDGPGYA